MGENAKALGMLDRDPGRGQDAKELGGGGGGEAKAAEPEQTADSLEMHRKRLRQGRAASSKDVEMLEGQGFSALADEEDGSGANDVQMG